MHTKPAHVSHCRLSFAFARAREYLRQRNQSSLSRPRHPRHASRSNTQTHTTGTNHQGTPDECSLRFINTHTFRQSTLKRNHHHHRSHRSLSAHLLSSHAASHAPGNQLSEAAPRVVVFTFCAARARGATVVAKTRACANIGSSIGRVREWRLSRAYCSPSNAHRARPSLARRPSNPAIESRGIRCSAMWMTSGATCVFERCHRLCIHVLYFLCHTMRIEPVL